MGSRTSIKHSILAVLSDGKPKSARDVVASVGLKEYRIWNSLAYWWKGGLLLRSEKPTFESIEVFRGRAGMTKNTRAYYLYVLKRDGKTSVQIEGRRFVPYKKEYLDARGARETSKAKLILGFLKENSDSAFFSIEIVKALADKGVKIRDIMATVRRYESLVYVRGYRTEQGQTPFKEGYILTWIDQDKSREQALEEAVQKTNKILARKSSTSPIIERIHLIRDMVIESTKLKDLTSFSHLENEIGCSEHELRQAVNRVLQLYPDIREVKLFGAYRHYYHTSLSQEDLQASIKMKEIYIRIVKGRDNRIGHNWEAVPERFVDRFTTGARFWTQKHRTDNMDERRITIHLIKPVGGRRNNAEVDRVWEVSPGIFANPITYVLECKWGLIEKKYIDDFFEVLRWSKEFGVDSSEGRQTRQGVIGVFAGSAFDPKGNVKLKNESVISLASYAARINVQLLKAADFNEKMRERGFEKEITAQRICRIAKDEKEVRILLEDPWDNPEKSNQILAETITRNNSLYEFEMMLQGKTKTNELLD